MGRPAIDTHAAADLSKRANKALRQWEKDHGTIGDSRMAAEIFRTTGVYFNRGTLTKLWAGQVDPHTVGIETILAIARFFEVDPDDFGPVIAERRRLLATLVYGDSELTGAGAGGRSTTFNSDDPAIGIGLECDLAGSGRVSPDSAGVVQRQNISFPS